MIIIWLANDKTMYRTGPNQAHTTAILSINVTYDATRMNINYPFLAVLINRTMITVSQHSINLFLFGTKYSIAKLILLEDNANW